MHRKRLPNLGSLRVFEAAARRERFTAAAEELNVTHGAVSKQIQALEQDLGVALFDRRNRGVHLTPRGRWLAERLSMLFGDLDRTMRDFHAQDVAPGPLTVSCEPTLCLRLLIPAAAELKRETGLDVRVLAAGGPVDFRLNQVDVAIRRSDFAIPPGIVAVPLAAEWMGPVMSPALADRSPEAQVCLHSATRPDAWRDWLARSQADQGGADIWYEHFYLALQAAEAGQGVALASIHMVASDLAAGRLCAPQGFAPDGTRYVALCPADMDDERVDRLVAWLGARMAANIPAPAGRDPGPEYS